MPVSTGPATSVPDVARHQGGVFTRYQALTSGWTERQVRRRISGGRWRYVAGVAISADPAPDSAYRRAWAAQLTWPDSVVALRVAGVLHGFPVAPGDAVEVYCPAARAASRGLRVVRRSVTTDDMEIFGGLVVTTPKRTALDLLGALAWTDSLALYAFVSSRGVICHADIGPCVRDRFGCPGTAQLIRLMRLTRDGAVSVGERVAHDLLRAADIRGWRAGAEIWDGGRRVAVVDLLFEEARLVVEIDGYRAHSGRETFEQDRQRQNRLIRLGYRVLRFTWRDLVERPDSVVQQIRSLL